MSTKVSEAAVEEVSGALNRTLASYSSPQWVSTAVSLVKSGGNQAAAELAPGETVEWLTPGIVHRDGKVWPEAILLVTPHRLIVTASRGSLRTKRIVNSLYRGPESLIDVSHRMMPGSSADHWMLEIATQDGPFLFAIPNFVGSDSLAQITGTFVTGRARYAPDTGTTVDGAPWGTPVAAPQTAGFAAARADLAGEAATETAAEPVAEAPAETPAEAHDEAPVTPDLGGPPTEAFTWPEAAPVPDETAPTPVAVQEFWSPFQDDAPAEPFAPPAETYQAPAAYEAPVVEHVPPAVAVAEPEPEPEPAPEPAVIPAQRAAELPPADWYPDPLAEARLRYWDGQAWTHSTAS